MSAPSFLTAEERAEYLRSEMEDELRHVCRHLDNCTVPADRPSPRRDELWQRRAELLEALGREGEI